MKEQIYTIPVTEAFGVDCECPLCLLEKKLEDEYVDYILGPSLMEPEGRMETNDKGFCRRHAEFLFENKSSKHGLGLILDTHIEEQTNRLRKMYESKKSDISKELDTTILQNLSNKLTAKKTATEKFLDEIISSMDEQQSKCALCTKLDYTMGRYLEVILYLWFHEEDFRQLFNSKKGFCQKHFRFLLGGSKKHLSSREKPIFIKTLLEMQIENLDRVQKEVNWFTKKFDYRYNNEPWGNSKDAVPRSLQKIVGFCRLK